MKIGTRSTSDIKKAVLLAILSSQCIVLSIIEGWLPVSIGIPGVKLGLANIIIIILLFYFNLSNVMLVILIKCIISSLLMGSPIIFAFSLFGGILSTFVMWMLIKNMQKWFSLVGVSIAGAIVHNSAQIAVACFIMNDTSVIIYTPVLILSGLVAGSFTGCCSTFLLKAVRKLYIVANY